MDTLLCRMAYEIPQWSVLALAAAKSWLPFWLMAYVPRCADRSQNSLCLSNFVCACDCFFVMYVSDGFLVQESVYLCVSEACLLNHNTTMANPSSHTESWLLSLYSTKFWITKGIRELSIALSAGWWFGLENLVPCMWVHLGRQTGYALKFSGKINIA